MVGLESAGKLGNVNQASYILNFYISDTLQPEQRRDYELWQKLKPDLHLEYITMQLPKIAEVNNSNISVDKGLKAISKAVSNDLLNTEYELKQTEDLEWRKAN